MIKTSSSKIFNPYFYWLVLVLVSLWVLVTFLTPSARHSGLNLYKETQFPDMVQGTAYKPFVYRTLLPSTVRILTNVAPEAWHQKTDLFTEENQFAKQSFDRFGWEYNGSFQYYLAALFIWASYIGFAHVTVALTCHQLKWPASIEWRAFMGAVALLGLPAMFKYSSFPYDPTQLFLFSFALYLLASERMRAFLVVFLFCCLSKETAVLLIPIHAVFRWGRQPRPIVWRESLFLAISFAIIKGALTWVFWDNPGSLVEFHLLDHNVPWVLGQWHWVEFAVALVLAWLVFFRWKDKPHFLRIALLWSLPALAGMALIFGFIDEWRGYYEVYAIVFAMVVGKFNRAAKTSRTLLAGKQLKLTTNQFNRFKSPINDPIKI